MYRTEVIKGDIARKNKYGNEDKQGYTIENKPFNNFIFIQVVILSAFNNS